MKTILNEKGHVDFVMFIVLLWLGLIVYCLLGSAFELEGRTTAIEHHLSLTCEEVD